MVLKKRKRATGLRSGGSAAKAARKGGAPAADDGAANLASEDELSSDADGGEAAGAKSDAEDDEFFETADEKRVRLAKEYLSRLGADGEKPQEEVQEQLARDTEDQAKRTRMQIEDVQLGKPVLRRKAHEKAVTCVCLSSDDSTAYTGGKDCRLVRWDLETGKFSSYAGGYNRFQCGGHFQQVLGVCLVEPRQLLVSGGVDRLVRFWDPRAPPEATCKQALHGHLGPVTAVAAEEDGSTLYTASLDRSLKIWDLRTRRCTDTLFGHVTGVNCMDLHSKNRPTTGGADKTVRLWKTDRETHLMFARHTYSVDAVTVVDQDRVVSAGQDGNMFLWSNASKKPLATVALGSGKWITALRAIRQRNVVFSGGTDGFLRCWRFGRNSGDNAEDKTLRFTEAAEAVAVPGCINGIAVGRKVLVAAVGKEHKLGRWIYEKKYRNGLLLLPLSYREV